MGRGIAGRRYWFTLFDCTAHAIAGQSAKHRFRRPDRACTRRISSSAMVSLSRLAKRPGKTWRATASHGQRATVAHVSINTPLSSRLSLELLPIGRGLDFGSTQESMELHRLTDCRFSRRYHRREFFTGPNSLLAAHSGVRIFS